MRLPSFVTLTPRNAPTGKLTLRMICGSRSSPRRWRTRRAARSAQRSKEKCSPTSAEKATEGMFSSAPSKAAEMVPEYVTSSPRFGPKLMPETTMSGRSSFISFSTARFTPAVEVPDEVAHYWRATAAAYGHVVVGERVGLPRGYRVIVWALMLTPDDN